MSSQSGSAIRSAAPRRINVGVRQGSKQQDSGRAPVIIPDLKRDESSTQDASDDDPRTTNSRAPCCDFSSSVSLAVPALGNSTLWRYNSVGWVGGFEPVGLDVAHRRARSLCTRLMEANDYLESADAAWDELCFVRRQLQAALDCTTAHEHPLRIEALQTLSGVYERLGDYDEAQKTFQTLCPELPLGPNDFARLDTWHKTNAMLDYLQLLAWTTRDLDRAEIATRALPWAKNIFFSEDLTSNNLFCLIKILNHRGRHEDAYKHLEIFDTVFPARMSRDRYVLQKAIAATGKDLQDEAMALFIESLLLRSLVLGRWHIHTLDSIYHFGRALKAWGKHDSARKLLMNCCQGLFYTLGASHPLSVRAYEEVKACENVEPSVQSLRWLGHAQYGLRKKWSTAYMHNYVITPIELLKSSVDMDYERTTHILEDLLAQRNTTARTIFETRRSLAWCAFAQNQTSSALLILSDLYHQTKDVSSDTVDSEAFRTILASDEAIFSAESESLSRDSARQRSKSVYLGLRDSPKRRNHQIKAVLKRLTMYDLTHFTHEIVFSDPPLISEVNRESLGSGSFATVDTVKVGNKLYARKSINLPHQRQAHLREDVQKEIRVIHTLRHPHIVRVLFTYEETRRICIIIHPLAECDLETYLSNRTCRTEEDRCLSQKWMLCLTNTLAFIHTKGVRHKDIKPRNILVKGLKIYFADFGSCYVFSDSGNSTTDGIAHGHTRAYCAPEVIKHTDRNRSSDVFSLGCVLAELTAWSSQIAITDYFKSMSANKDDHGNGQPQYHESTKCLKHWFRECPDLASGAKDIFSEVLRHMIHKKPEKRWTAVDVSRALCNYLPVACEKCSLDLWVADFTDRHLGSG